MHNFVPSMFENIAFRSRAASYLSRATNLARTRQRRLTTSYSNGSPRPCSSTRTISSTPPTSKSIARGAALNTPSQESAVVSGLGDVRNLLNNVPRSSILPIVGNVAYIAIASGFLMTDMLQLRLLLIGGYSGLVAFHSLHERPLRIPLRWSAVFVAVNMGAAGMLLMDRYAPDLNSAEHPDGEALYEQYFADKLTRGQFRQLLTLAKRQYVPAGTVLTRENQVSDSMSFLSKGEALVYHGKDVAKIEEGGFVNDVAFQQGPGSGAYGTVVTSKNCEILAWDIQELRKHLSSRLSMERNMKYCMSDHLVKSLLRQREAAHQRQQKIQTIDQ